MMEWYILALYVPIVYYSLSHFHWVCNSFNFLSGVVKGVIYRQHKLTRYHNGITTKMIAIRISKWQKEINTQTKYNGFINEQSISPQITCNDLWFLLFLLYEYTYIYIYILCDCAPTSPSHDFLTALYNFFQKLLQNQQQVR